jgi:hypothetical protein
MQRSRTRTYRSDADGGYADRRRGPQLIRWGAVFGGTVLALGLLVLLASFWFALAYGSEISAVRNNLEWYLGGSAIVCLFIGGILAGWLSGVRGWGPGFINGLTIWALLLIVTFSVGVPSALNVFSLGRISNAVANGPIVAPGVDTAMWASFWSLLIGFFTAAIGGAIGGALTRPAEVYGPGRGTDVAYEEEEEVQDPTATRRTRAS